MNEIYLRFLAKKYTNNPTEDGIQNFIKQMQDNTNQDKFYEKFIKPEGRITPDEFKEKLSTVWYKDYPCIANNTKMFSDGGYSYATFTSSIKANGVIRLEDDGSFTTENSTRFPDGGKWSCSSTGKIFLQDNVQPTTGDTQQSTTATTATTTTKPKFEWKTTLATPENVENGEIISYGMYGSIVKQIQQLLINNGYKDISKNGQADGKFGNRTKNAVISFQTDYNETPDGKVGPKTWKKLVSGNIKPINQSTVTEPTAPEQQNMTTREVPAMNQLQQENNMKKLNNIIKENLIQTKENKKKTLQESKIVKTRMDFIVETNKTNLDSALLSVLFEMFYLDNQGFNGKIIQENVESVFGALGNIFGNKHNEVSERFKEIGVRHILGKLDVSSDTGLGDFLMVALSNTDIKDVPKLFSDCDYLTNKIANAIPEAYLNQLKYDEGMGSEFMEKVKSSLADVIKESDFSDKIKDRIKGIICPLVDNMQEKFGNHLSSMKSKLTSSTQA